ncbi:MAG: hypothetical protein ACJ72Z_06270, partial [Pyrinomonadaceae bacterium]
TTRDTIANTTDGTDTGKDGLTVPAENSNKKDADPNADKSKSGPATGPGVKPQQSPSAAKPTSGEQRPRPTKP